MVSPPHMANRRLIHSLSRFRLLEIYQEGDVDAKTSAEAAGFLDLFQPFCLVSVDFLDFS